MPVVVLGVLGGMALAAGAESPALRLLVLAVAMVPSGRALWILLPGFGGSDALRFTNGTWSLRWRGCWLPVDCIAKVAVHQAGWWVVFRCASRRHWVWLGMRSGDPDFMRELARALRSASDPWATRPRQPRGG